MDCEVLAREAVQQYIEMLSEVRGGFSISERDALFRAMQDKHGSPTAQVMEAVRKANIALR